MLLINICIYKINKMSNNSPFTFTGLPLRCSKGDLWVSRPNTVPMKGTGLHYLPSDIGIASTHVITWVPWTHSSIEGYCGPVGGKPRSQYLTQARYMSIDVSVTLARYGCDSDEPCAVSAWKWCLHISWCIRLCLQGVMASGKEEMGTQATPVFPLSLLVLDTLWIAFTP